MNGGYVNLDEDGYPVDELCELPEKYKKWRYQALLYKKVLETAGITSETKGTLLEVSCGLGGGLGFIHDNFTFNKLYGLDITPEHIDYCKKYLKTIEFLHGSAMNIPLPRDSVDFILTIEALFHYLPLPKFISEVNRTLKPGGILAIYTNFTENNPINKFHLNIRGVKVVKVLDITPNCNIAAAISKWKVPNFYCRKAIQIDELRHFQEKSKHEIIICQKI